MVPKGEASGVSPDEMDASGPLPEGNKELNKEMPSGVSGGRQLFVGESKIPLLVSSPFSGLIWLDAPPETLPLVLLLLEPCVPCWFSFS